MTVSPRSASSSCSASSWAYCRVSPQRLATLTTSVALPALSAPNVVCVHCSVVTGRSDRSLNGDSPTRPPLSWVERMTVAGYSAENGWRPRGSRGLQCACDSDVVVERELVRVRAQADGVDLVLPLVAHPGLDEISGEDAALEQVVVVGLECVEHRVQRPWHLGDRLCLVRRQLVEILVDRRRRLDLVPDAVEAGEQHRREREVGICRGVRHPELDPLGLRVGAGDRDAAARRAVAL